MSRLTGHPAVAKVLDVTADIFGDAAKLFGNRGGHGEPIQLDKWKLLEQSVRLTTANSAEARKAIHLMLPRLSPMPPDQILWDIKGPFPDDKLRPWYDLAMVKRTDYADLSSDAGLLVKARNGGAYLFTDEGVTARRRAKTLKRLLAGGLIYFGLLFVSDALAARNLKVVEALEARQTQMFDRVRLATTEKESLQSQNRLIADHFEGEAAAKVLLALGLIAETLNDGELIRTIRFDGNGWQMNGLAASPATFVEALQAEFPGTLVLGPVNAERGSDLNRFSVTYTAPSGEGD